MSFVGYDNIESSEFMEPALTTVNVPLAELGKSAVGTLIELSEGEANREKVLATNLVKRSSVLDFRSRKS